LAKQLEQSSPTDDKATGENKRIEQAKPSSKLKTQHSEMIAMLADQTPVLKFQNKRKHSASKTSSSRPRKDEYENVETHPGSNDFKRPVPKSRKDVTVNEFESDAALAEKWAKRVGSKGEGDPSYSHDRSSRKSRESNSGYSNSQDIANQWEDKNPYKPRGKPTKKQVRAT
jgi:hypothetical protein